MNPFAEMYDRPEVVAEYLGNVLDKSEVRLLHELFQRPRELVMLDLGVGAGRTAGFFARFTRTYLGIDVAPRMIATCRERFGTVAGCDFQIGDAAALDHLADASFDIVLFSFNGLDCLEPAHREVCLRSVRRLLRAGGIFLFSAHNLQMIDFYYQVPPAGSDESRELTAERREKIARYNDAPSP